MEICFLGDLIRARREKLLFSFAPCSKLSVNLFELPFNSMLYHL